LLDHDCTGAEQDERGVTLRFANATACAPTSPLLRWNQFCFAQAVLPRDKLAFAGINTWRG